MRDEGLQLAIDAAGGVGALARALGIRQPSVSSWAKVPAERVLAVEQSTGVQRSRLRPDLYPTDDLAHESGTVVATRRETEVQADPLEQARARYYLLLGKLLRQAPTTDMLAGLARLGGDHSPLGMAQITLAEEASRTSEADVATEYFSLFIGIGRGEILPYTSFYLTGFLHERPLAAVRSDLGRLGIERAEGNFDPEDHLGLLLEVMGGMIDGTFEGDLDEQRRFFSAHIAPWAERCLADITVAPSAKLYKSVAALGSLFLAVERDAFEIDD